MYVCVYVCVCVCMYVCRDANHYDLVVIITILAQNYAITIRQSIITIWASPGIFFRLVLFFFSEILRTETKRLGTSLVYRLVPSLNFARLSSHVHVHVHVQIIVAVRFQIGAQIAPECTK